MNVLAKTLTAGAFVTAASVGSSQSPASAQSTRAPATSAPTIASSPTRSSTEPSAERAPGAQPSASSASTPVQDQGSGSAPTAQPAQDPSKAQALESPRAPAVLRLRAGVQPARVLAMSYDRRSQRLLTLAQDRTLAMYHGIDGTRLSAFRLPITSPHPGGAASLSVGGRVAASMGDAQVLVFEPESESPLQQLEHDQPVTALSLSADGSTLAVGLGGSGGLLLYRWDNQRYTLRSRAPEGHGAVQALTLLPTDELAVSSPNGEVRIYTQALELRARRQLDQAPGALAVSDSARAQLAVGSQNTPRVEVFDLDLSPTANHIATGVGAEALSRVCWIGPADKQQLVAARASSTDTQPGLVTWTEEGEAGDFGATSMGHGRASALTSLPGGDLVLAIEPFALVRLDRYGGEVWRVVREVPDFRDQAQSLALSWNGRRVRFTGRSAAAPIIYSPAGKGGGGKFFTPRQTGLPLQNWADSTRPTLDGKALALGQGETAHTLAVDASGEYFVLGTDRALRMYNASGAELWRRPLPSSARAVNIARNGQLLVAGLADGRLAWFRLVDGLPVLSLLHHTAGKGFVAWTPEGFFDDVGEGGALLGYELDRGAARSPTFVQIDQLRDHYHRPELVLGSLSRSRAAVVEAASGLGDPRETIGTRLPPEIEVVSTETRASELLLRYRLRDQGGGIGDLRVRLDDRLVAPTRTRAPGPAAPQGQAIFEQAISLHPGENLVSLIVENRAGDLRSAPVQLSAINAEVVEGSGKLHLLAVGVSNYDDPYLRRSVRWARDDALGLGELMRGSEGALFSKVLVTSLLDASLADILSAFAKMRQDVHPQDTFVFYLAGHGIARNGRYHFLPRDLVELDDQSLERGSLNEEHLVTMLSQIQAERSLVLLDTCSAGAALPGREIELKAAIDRLHRESGQVFIAASGDSQKALELPQSHSAFALVVMQALQGQANRGNDGLIDVDELGDYVLDQLPQLTRDRFGYEQRPIRKGDARFPISSAKLADPGEP